MNHWFERQSQRALNLVQTAEAHAQMIPGINVLIQAVRAYGEDHCSLLAASLSYYALLSIFPLMLFLFAVASYFIPPDRVAHSVAGFFTANLPFSTTLLQNNLQEVTRLRGVVTLVAAAGFVWSASGVFEAIQVGINRAFRVPRPRPLWRQRLVSLVMVFFVGLLFGLSFALTTAMRLMVHYHVLRPHTLFTDALPTIGTLILSTIVFLLLYRFIPADSGIGWRDVWLSALIAAALWEIAKLIFAWYLTNYALLNLVYGSVGAVIAIMLWSYVTAAILLLGAEIAAVKAGARQREKKGNEWWALVSNMKDV
jgi:membrane protein